MIKKSKLLFSLQQISKIFPRTNLKTSKSSQYGKSLRESNKIKKFYGDPSLNYLKKLFQKKQYFPFQKQETFFRFLESRLDIVLYRSGFFESINTAKQQIRLGCVDVNKRTVFSPKYILQPGDVVNIVSKSRTPLESLHSQSKGFSSKLKLNKKEIAWRFQRSPFLLSLINKASALTSSADQIALEREVLNNSNSVIAIPNLNIENRNEGENKSQSLYYDKMKEKNVFDDCNETKRFIFEKFICFSSTNTIKNNTSFDSAVTNSSKQSLFNRNAIKQVFLTAKQKQSLITFYRSKIFERQEKLLKSLKQNTDQIVFKRFKDCFIRLLPQKVSISNLNKQAQIKDLYGQTEFQNNWLFLIYNLFLKKKVTNRLKPKNSQNESKAFLNFFKNQHFFASKKVKPLHLEISYKSRSIIFLFPPQRICLPNYINLSQIVK